MTDVQTIADARDAAVLRPGRAEDAADLAELANEAGEGLPLYLWGQMAEAGQSPWSVGTERARRGSGAFSYGNATVIEVDGRVGACLIGYPLALEVEPLAPDMPPLFRPLQELENLVPGSWYVNILAVRPEHRRRGYATRLLKHAEDIAISLGRRRMSVIAIDANRGARRLYRRSGYSKICSKVIVKEGWRNPGQHWVLLTKAL